MKLKDLKKTLNGLGPGYNEHDIVIHADHHGPAPAYHCSANTIAVEDGCELEIWETTDEDAPDGEPCIVLWGE